MDVFHSTGLFFGSFNPIHNGHIAIARYLLENGYCGSVWFIVSPQNPWKVDSILLDERKRLQIVEKAVEREERMEASDFEFSMPRPSYTYQTLEALQAKYPAMDFSLIIGGDNLQRFHLWKNYREVLADFPLIVYPRPGILIPEITGANMTIVDAPLTDISSTEIRDKVKVGEDISDRVPSVVLPLIQKYYSV